VIPVTQQHVADFVDHTLLVRIGALAGGFGTGWPSTALPHLVRDGERSLTVQGGERSLGVNPGVGHQRWRPRPVGVCRTGEPEHQRGTEDQYRNGECDSVPGADDILGHPRRVRPGPATILNEMPPRVITPPFPDVGTVVPSAALGWMARPS
jgi:hypothetical protein